MDAKQPAICSGPEGSLDRQDRIASAISLPGIIGFYFSFRIILVVVAVRILQQDPQFGTVLSIGLNFLLLGVVAFHSLGAAQRSLHSILELLPCRLALVFLALSGASLTWTAADSLSAAVAFWCAMAADLAMVVLLLQSQSIEEISGALIKGYVLGACCVAAGGWILPTQLDLRLGDGELLGPNAFGYICALAIFLGQYAMRLERTQRGWNLLLAFLGVTLLRTLSKTSIIAFLARQAFLLFRDRSIPRKTKYILIAVSLTILAVGWGLLQSYLNFYVNEGTQAETLSGRLGIWAIMLAGALDQPWLGHGFHSIWKVIPPFGADAFEIRHAHNELLQQFYAYGVVGVVLVISIYASFYRQIRKLAPSSLRALLMGLLIFILVRGLTDTEAFDLSLPLWSIVLLTVSMNHLTMPPDTRQSIAKDM